MSRLHCESESFKMDLILDINSWLYPMELGKLCFLLVILMIIFLVFFLTCLKFEYFQFKLITYNLSLTCILRNIYSFISCFLKICLLWSVVTLRHNEIKATFRVGRYFKWTDIWLPSYCWCMAKFSKLCF